VPRSRGSFQARPRSRRRTGWEEGPGIQTPVTTSSSESTVLGAGQLFAVDGHTIVRLRGFVELNLHTVAAIGDGFAGAMAIGIVTQAAFAVGISAVPTPITEIEWEGWMWHQFFSVHAHSVTGGESNKGPVQVFEIDSKAMRKIGSDEVIYAVYEGTEVGTSAMVITLGTRMLLKLP